MTQVDFRQEKFVKKQSPRWLTTGFGGDLCAYATQPVGAYSARPVSGPVRRVGQAVPWVVDLVFKKL